MDEYRIDIDNPADKFIGPCPFTESLPSHAKSDINNLLWTLLPPHTTLDRGEQIACAIYEAIRDEWECEDKKNKPPDGE